MRRFPQQVAATWNRSLSQPPCGPPVRCCRHQGSCSRRRGTVFGGFKHKGSGGQRRAEGRGQYQESLVHRRFTLEPFGLSLSPGSPFPWLTWATTGRVRPCLSSLVTVGKSVPMSAASLRPMLLMTLTLIGVFPLPVVRCFSTSGAGLSS